MANAWDSYIDSLIGHGKGHIDRAVIIGLNGGGKWTTKLELKLSPEESAKIAQVFNSKDYTSLQANGAQIEGQKYQFLQVQDDKVLLFKKKDFGSVTMQRTKTAVVIAHTPEGKQQGNAAAAVSSIADYLEQNSI